jgi:beta-lactamase superfamily II metal-dependent hydrolase
MEISACCSWETPGFQAEQRLLESSVDLHADVLKVGHHGSAYSSAPGFIAAVSPRYALISVGRHNLFGHPAASTLSTLRSAGTETYRTDLCGATIVRAETNVSTTTNLSCSAESAAAMTLWDRF